mmetsp:Transcript_2196/g.4080  ORF Transcript_2196/g.4080 Transcript_2196/m.4080 type:complete len:289 (-) Transcript_2196:148-1014(-)|eukprot:CAMPEP_0196666026 /NCGR_PEP_ID=MMETSP1086-20130531/63569_1 /TAXON_ID=77921 /ORGANISM="Cyanoptyche  gloeocystis , Strain SAG4.97" /LENGTH=288 /DNA_ID=CAMNT_0042003069 /DNA_START=123 /DNA_END=989 /DNA_ORIENTATION=+
MAAIIGPKFLDAVIQGYMKRTPTAVRVIQELQKVGENVVNDHVAFRSFGVNNLGISSMDKILTSSGYTKMNQIDFPEKKLTARWYKPEQEGAARVFISELLVNELSPKSQNILHKYLSRADQSASVFAPVASVCGFRPWPTPSSTDFDALAEESEYASWTLVNAYDVNHVTMSCHVMRQLNTLEKLNQFLLDKGFVLNDSGTLIKTSPDGLLKQSSTIADKVEVAFADGVRRSIANSYVEFAERLVLPQYSALPADQITDAHRRDGFEARNADKIFESTYEHQVSRAG